MPSSDYKKIASIIANEDSNVSTQLRINPKYEVQTRPYTVSEYKRLKDSMMELGQEQPIMIDEAGFILDGHHRFKVCEELGIPPRVMIRKYENEEQKIRAINDHTSPLQSMGTIYGCRNKEG